MHINGVSSVPDTRVGKGLKSRAVWGQGWEDPGGTGNLEGVGEDRWHVHRALQCVQDTHVHHLVCPPPKRRSERAGSGDNCFATFPAFTFTDISERPSPLPLSLRPSARCLFHRRLTSHLGAFSVCKQKMGQAFSLWTPLVRWFANCIAWGWGTPWGQGAARWAGTEIVFPVFYIGILSKTLKKS